MIAFKIANISAIEIFDSRGYPTIETTVTLDTGDQGRVAIPSGASTGIHEAVERRDEDEQRFDGKGVLQAISSVEHIIQPELIGFDVADQVALDELLLEIDGSTNKSHCGANAILSVSLAAAKAYAAAQVLPFYAHLAEGKQEYILPQPMLNVINGGMHANNDIDFQEFMFVPHNFSSLAESLRAAAECTYKLRMQLKAQGKSTAVGDEGGFAPQGLEHEQVMDLLCRSIEMAGYRPGEDISLALDVAASTFYKDNQYHCQGKTYDAPSWVAFWQAWLRRYPIISIEDAMAEEDWTGWALLSSVIGKQVQLVGDDLFATQVALLDRGIDEGVANAILIKPNQVGTVTETLLAMALARKSGYRTVVSHRSGDTEDDWLADFAVGTAAGQIKCGALCRSERTAKYNQLLRIERELGKFAQFIGGNIYKAQQKEEG
jgi:enolase